MAKRYDIYDTNTSLLQSAPLCNPLLLHCCHGFTPLLSMLQLYIYFWLFICICTSVFHETSSCPSFLPWMLSQCTRVLTLRWIDHILIAPHFARHPNRNLRVRPKTVPSWSCGRSPSEKHSTRNQWPTTLPLALNIRFLSSYRRLFFLSSSLLAIAKSSSPRLG